MHQGSGELNVKAKNLTANIYSGKIKFVVQVVTFLQEERNVCHFGSETDFLTPANQNSI